VANATEDLAARVDALEEKVAAVQPQMAGTNQPAAGPTSLQAVLPEIKDLSQKVGGLEHLSEIVENLKQPEG
jgi:hypothetical protein